MRAGAVCVVIAALLFSAVLQAQNVGSVLAAEGLDQLQTALRKARAQGDWASYLEMARQIRTLLNGSPQSRLEVARAETHAGHLAAAMDELVTDGSVKPGATLTPSIVMKWKVNNP